MTEKITEADLAAAKAIETGKTDPTPRRKCQMTTLIIQRTTSLTLYRTLTETTTKTRYAMTSNKKSK